MLKNTDSNTRAALNLWNAIMSRIEGIIGEKVRIVYPGSSDPYYQWFVQIESESFRTELRYSSEELEESLTNENVLFFFISSDSGNEAVVLAYDDPDNPQNTLYLDTIAVKRRGLGIGSLLMQTLVNYAQTRSYHSIRLDTELVNEKGQELVKFYKTLGFQEISSTEDGNITMELIL